MAGFHGNHLNEIRLLQNQYDLVHIFPNMQDRNPSDMSN